LGSHCDRDHETPLLCGSLATEAINIWVWPGWRVADGGVTATERAACGGGVTAGGGSLPGAGEWALEFGTEAQPPSKRADKDKMAAATGRRTPARTPGSENKVQVSNGLLSGSQYLHRDNCREP
jgi:hypothetical protein